jgi:hypothetical protein
VEITERGTYQKIGAAVVDLAADGSPRNILCSTYRDADPLAAVTITAQAGGISDQSSPAYSYAWRLALDDFEPIPLAQLEASVPTLRRISRRLDQLAADYGEPATFGAYLARVATILRVRIITGQAGTDGDYSTGTWTLWSPREAADMIDSRTAAHYRRNHPAAA